MLKCGVFIFSGHKGGEEMARLERRCRCALYWYDKKYTVLALNFHKWRHIVCLLTFYRPVSYVPNIKLKYM